MKIQKLDIYFKMKWGHTEHMWTCRISHMVIKPWENKDLEIHTVERYAKILFWVIWVHGQIDTCRRFTMNKTIEIVTNRAKRDKIIANRIQKVTKKLLQIYIILGITVIPWWAELGGRIFIKISWDPKVRMSRKYIICRNTFYTSDEHLENFIKRMKC